MIFYPIINIIGDLRVLFFLRKTLVLSTILLGLTGCAQTVAIPSLPPEKVNAHIETLGVTPSSHLIVIDTKAQTLAVLKDNRIKHTYTISTSKRGLGQRIDTYKTPQGLHRVNEKIGDGVPHQGIFYRRQFVGEAWKPLPRHQHLKDFITTRILRLEGLQPGFNKGRDSWGRNVDSEHRAIYIHGTTMEWKLGAPSTKGCVHMSAKDVVHLFNSVPVGTLVWIN